MTTILEENAIDLTTFNENMTQAYLDEYIKAMDKRDPLRTTFEMMAKKIQKNEEIIKQQQEIINERKLDGIHETLQELIHYKDEETIPYLLKKYENNIDELEKYVDDVLYKLIDLHKLTFDYEDFTLINLNSIGCVADAFFDNRHKYEDYKELTFIGFITYIHMSYESGMIGKDELKALLNDLFDYDWQDVTNGLYSE